MAEYNWATLGCGVIAHQLADAMKAKDQLVKSGCKLLGAVLNKVDMKKEKYYSKYNSYYYGKSKQE